MKSSAIAMGNLKGGVGRWGEDYSPGTVVCVVQGFKGDVKRDDLWAEQRYLRVIYSGILQFFSL